MSHTLYYDTTNDCIVLTVEGIVTLARIREIAPEVGAMCEKTGCRRLLNDMRTATLAISLIDAYTKAPGLWTNPGFLDR